MRRGRLWLLAGLTLALLTSGSIAVTAGLKSLPPAVSRPLRSAPGLESRHHGPLEFSDSTTAGLKSRPPAVLRSFRFPAGTTTRRTSGGPDFRLRAGASARLAGAVAEAVSPSRIEATRVSMGCTYAIAAYGDRDSLPRTLEDALDEVDRIDRLLSHYKRDSPLSRLNREAAHATVAVDPELFAFIDASLEYSRRSDGAFDITVGPLMKAWGFFEGDGRVPDPAELASVRRLVGYRHVHLDPTHRRVRFDMDGVELDPGGVGKGYAIDRVVSLLRRRGVTAALVSAGGSTVYGLGAPPGTDGWDVTIDDPIVQDKPAFTVRLRDRALSIAGSAGKFFDAGGTRYTHIMDPRTGKPVMGVLSVALLTRTGIDGDAWDDALFVLGPEESRPYMARLPGTEAYFLLPEGRRWKMVRLP